jgi:hypothetical protein
MTMAAYSSATMAHHDYTITTQPEGVTLLWSLTIFTKLDEHLEVQN